MTQPIDKDLLERARAWLYGDAERYGHHAAMPFKTLQITQIFLTYEHELVTMQEEHNVAFKIQDDAHQRAMAELHGKIGGLTKQLNKVQQGK